MSGVFDLRPPPTGSEHAIVGNGAVLPVLALGSLKVKFNMPGHSNNPPSDFFVKLTDVQSLEGLQFNLFFLHQVQKIHRVLLSESGVYLFDGKLCLDRNKRSSV